MYGFERNNRGPLQSVTKAAGVAACLRGVAFTIRVCVWDVAHRREWGRPGGPENLTHPARHRLEGNQWNISRRRRLKGPLGPFQEGFPCRSQIDLKPAEHWLLPV